MIVVITSWAPVVALRKPAMAPHRAPAREAATIAKRMCWKLPISVNLEPM
jgi:hypothetical protein